MLNETNPDYLRSVVGSSNFHLNSSSSFSALILTIPVDLGAYAITMPIISPTLRSLLSTTIGT